MKNNLAKKTLHILSTCVAAVIIASCANPKSSWMEDNYQAINSKTISQITMPGSHIANAYNINSGNVVCKGEIVPNSLSSNAQLQHYITSQSTLDQELFLSYLNTQDNDVYHQLKNGIRYLEFQICKQDGHYYTSNYYLTGSLAIIADQIKDFLEHHSQEIVILDFDNNLWNENGYMDGVDLATFYNNLEKTFGSSITPKDKANLTIGELKNQHYQIILMSSNPILNSYPNVWDKSKIAIAPPAEYSTIKKITTLQDLIGNNESKADNKLAILPVYSKFSLGATNSSFSKTDEDDWIISNYLQNNIKNRPTIIVIDNGATNSITNIALPDFTPSTTNNFDDTNESGIKKYLNF